MEKLYQTIATDLKKQLDAGTLRAGDKLLTEKELCQRYHVSRTTVRSALKLVGLDGKLRRVKGSGTYVASMESFKCTTLYISSFADELKQRGIQVITEVIEFRFLSLEEDLPELGLFRGDNAVKLTRLRYGKGCFDKGPMVLTTSFFPAELGEILMHYDLEVTSLHDIFLKCGISRTVSKKTLSAARLSPKECRIAGEEEDALCVAVFSTSLDSDGKPIEYCRSFYPISRNSFEIIL